MSMYLRHVILMCLLWISNLAVAQSVWCPEDSLWNESRQNGTYDEFLRRVKAVERKPSLKIRSEEWYQVVVHIVRRDISQQISKAQIIQQIDILNEDFAGRGENISHLAEEFRSLIADTEIQFCLATVDPAGNPTEGITYTLTSVTDVALQTVPNGRIAIHYDQFGGQSGWDPTRYINIWVGEYGDYLGSAKFPGMSVYPEEIGIIIDIRAFGSLGDASKNGFNRGGHSLTHEMGHFFGLLHIWGGSADNCNDSDEVDDTPNSLGPYFSCPSGTQTSCGVSNMFQNFMDQTDDRCLAAFTQGQAERMQATIDIYFQNLDIAGPCYSTIEPFDRWWDELVWAYDQFSRQYIIYHPDGYSGNIEVEVFSVDGRLVQKDTWQGTQSFLLDLNTGGRGIYVVRITDGDYEVIRKVVSY